MVRRHLLQSAILLQLAIYLSGPKCRIQDALITLRSFVLQKIVGFVRKRAKLNMQSFTAGGLEMLMHLLFKTKGALLLQVGSLVVCLPTSHKGGALTVEHHGRKVVFDWSLPKAELSNAGICWAAFYSDCKHEVRIAA